MRQKNYRIDVRVSEIVLRRLNAICEVDGKSKTAIVEEMIYERYKKNKKYEDSYYKNIDKEM